MELGFDPEVIEIDPIKNFIIQIDKSICNVMSRKNRLPKELKALKGNDELITGEGRYSLCKFSNDLHNNKLTLYKQYLSQLRMSSEAYEKCLFPSYKEKKLAFQKMNSLQIFLNE